MRRANGFTLIELLLILVIISSILGMMMPNLKLMQSQARNAALRLNMRTVSLAIVSFLAENGHYAEDFYEDGYGYIFEGGIKDQELGNFPMNPFTGSVMDMDDFNVDQYSEALEVSNTTAGGPNDEWGYDEGTMRYSTFTPDGQYYPTMWGLIGFGRHGISLRDYDVDGEAVIFVLHQ